MELVHADGTDTGKNSHPVAHEDKEKKGSGNREKANSYFSATGDGGEEIDERFNDEFNEVL